ncbi:copper resistance protein CopC [Actinacidiphila sp. ITFR-21]|uniref:copper resistance CopC/CopD family protein n=1 Tax=Actinacidiphila sp. ITFR-21 TaxID=3075199 RepID=UPI00288C0959|nr:CopD family protein [Streptomyces sp. ITFR-21]WNI18008.1 CopD family protein [Streptomyces sp. ITFR-21]
MSRRSARRCALTLLALLGTLTGLALAAPPASAHAYVIATTPSDGTEVRTPPAGIRVTFDEPVTLPAAKGATSVVDAAGRDVSSGSVRLLDGRRTLVIGVRPGITEGSYIASWSVVSADTHPVGGSVQFGYGVPAVTIAAPPSERPSAGLQLAVGAVKGLLYLGLVAALGVLPAGLVLGAGPGERRVLWRAARIGAALAVLASAAQVVTQYLWDASAVPGGATWAGLRGFAGSAYGQTVFVRVGLLAAALAVLPPPHARDGGRRAPVLRWTAAGVLAAAVLGSVVRNGHGGTGAWWYFASTLVHVAAVVAWLGGLAVLGWLVLRRRLSLARLSRLPLWSRYATASVAVLALSGVLQGLVQVRYPAALTGTAYGGILLVKLTLVAAALLLGLRGNRWIGRQLARRDAYAADGRIAPGETARLRTRVRAEAGLGAVIVVVAGVLSSAAPAATAYAPTRVVHAAIGPYAVTIEVAPARRGPESFRVTAEGATDATAPVRSVQLDLGRPAGGVRALRVGFPYRLPGPIRPGRATAFTFVSSSVNVPGTGTWTGTLVLVAGPTEQYADAFHYRVL